MQNRAEKEASLTSFIVRSQGVDNATAKDAARAMMARLPAWKRK
jgi:hypothetical protein